MLAATSLDKSGRTRERDLVNSDEDDPGTSTARSAEPGFDYDDVDTAVQRTGSGTWFRLR
jgi:hypothetical protein